MRTSRAPKKPGDRRAWFKYQLDLVGSSFAAIGKSVGISRNAVRQGIHNPSERVANSVAATLGKDKAELWPERYRA